MGEFIELWLRGLVFTIVALVAVAILIGGLHLIAYYPTIGFAVVILIVMPLVLGLITEGK